MSRLSEVTNLPLLKIFAYIDSGRVEFVLAPTEYEWGNGVRGVVSRLSEVYKPAPIENICLHRFRPSRVCFAAHHV